MRKQVKTNAKAKAFRRKAIAQCPKMLRKQKRKQARLDKKAKKHAYYTHQQVCILETFSEILLISVIFITIHR